MTSRDEERQRLREHREEKEAEQRAKERKRLIAAYSGVGVLAIIIVAGAVLALTGGDDAGGDARVSVQSGQTNGVALDEREGIEPPPQRQTELRPAAREAGCEVRAKLPVEGRSHLPPEAQAPMYSTSPATSGNHVAPPFQQADGAYAEAPEEMNVVHSLEHGRLALQYDSELGEEEQLELRGLYNSAYSAALFFPNDEMPYEVAVSSWGEMLACERYEGRATLDAIRAFGAEYHGTAPEPMDAFSSLPGPTFGEGAS